MEKDWESWPCRVHSIWITKITSAVQHTDFAYCPSFHIHAGAKYSAIASRAWMLMHPISSMKSMHWHGTMSVTWNTSCNRPQSAWASKEKICLCVCTIHWHLSLTGSLLTKILLTTPLIRGNSVRLCSCWWHELRLGGIHSVWEGSPWNLSLWYGTWSFWSGGVHDLHLVDVNSAWNGSLK